MNKHIFTFLILLSASIFSASAIDFAPVGATWYYQEGFFSGPPEPKSDYMKFESVKDTMIHGEMCRKITKRHDLVCNFRPDVEYLFARNDTVFIYEEWLEDFVILYDFNANKLDSWQVPIKSWTEGEIDTLTLTILVDSVDYVDHNGHSLKRMFVNYYMKDNPILVYSTKIIERIGDVNYLFNPLFNWDIPCDGNYSQGLRCYQDEEIGLYETGIAETCDEIIPWHTSSMYDAKCESMNPHEIDTTYFWYKPDTLFIRNINNEYCTSDNKMVLYTIQSKVYDIGIIDYGDCLAECSFGYTLKIPMDPFDTIQVKLNYESFQVVYKDIVNSVHTPEESQLKMYPNPVSDWLTVDVDGIKSINVYALSGQLVSSQSGHKNALQLRNLEQGIYLVRVETLNGTYVRKIVKQ